MSQETSQITRTQSGGSRSKGSAPKRQSQKRTEALSVRSVLIEPRDNEPPRVSVSIEYSETAPDLKALKKVAMEVCHDVVKAQTFVDLGYREQQRSRELVQTFEVREKGES